MARVRFGDVVKEIKTNIDRATDNHEFYIAGEHMETENIHLTKRGRFEGSDVGPAFIRLFRPGQVLYGSRRTYLKKVAVADFEGITSNTTFVLETKDQNVMMQELLPFIMLTDSFTEYAIRNSKGSTNPYILFSDLCAYEFELPAIEEQRILTKRLLACDNVKEAYKHLIASTDELVKSQFVEMFGLPGTDTFGWGLVSLGSVCLINPKKSQDSRLVANLSVSFVSMPAVTEHGEIDATEKRKYDEVKTGFTYFAENDVLFAKITPCMENGKGAVARGLHNGIGFGSTEFHVLRPLKGVSDPQWIYTLTIFPQFRYDAANNMTGSAGQRRVPASFLESYRVAVPPIDLQEQFAAFVTQADKSKYVAQKATTNIRTYGIL